jgi:uncharacterized protein (DUF488 family)
MPAARAAGVSRFMSSHEAKSGTIYTVGHSTHTFGELVEMVKAHGVQAIADVRSIPRSRRVPQFNADALTADLPQAGIEYLPFKILGGRRRTSKHSINGAWRNASFRGYADYMQTDAFAEGLELLMEAALQRTIAMMCAEAVPWRCHRSMIGDALVVRGWRVLDIFSPTKATAHQLTRFAHVQGDQITYPPEPVEPDAPLFAQDQAIPVRQP